MSEQDEAHGSRSDDPPEPPPNDLNLRTQRQSPGDENTAPIIITPDMCSAVRKARIPFERGMSYRAKLSVCFITICSVVFVVQLTASDGFTFGGALVRERVLAGEIWRLITCMFLHGDPGHLIGNCLMLYVMGVAVEHAYDAKQFLLLYFGSGIIGGITSMLMHPGPSIGASGAIFGLIAVVIVFLFKNQKSFCLRDKRIAVVLVIWGCYTIGTGFFSPMVDNFAHLGGAIGGAALAWHILPDLIKRSRNHLELLT